LWPQGDAALDQEIAQRFDRQIEQAVAGGLGKWEQHHLGLVLLLDPFTRNAYNGQARPVTGDARARAPVFAALEKG
jgi:uncharacterized protein (DUF924 family)